ncbi:MAG: hypothetical protein V4509_00550 [Patescibacteria group bacterium]
MKNKLKILWFGLVPLSWCLAFLLVKWAQFYPINCDLSLPDSPGGLCIFIGLTGVCGTIILLFAGFGFAIYLQD